MPGLPVPEQIPLLPTVYGGKHSEQTNILLIEAPQFGSLIPVGGSQTPSRLILFGSAQLRATVEEVNFTIRAGAAFLLTGAHKPFESKGPLEAQH